MKKKLSRIVGVAVSVALVASLCVFAIPAATPAEAADLSWSTVGIPSGTGSVLVGQDENLGPVAISPNYATDSTMWAVINDLYTTAVPLVFKSTNGGHTWTATTTTLGTAGDVGIALAVSPNYALDSTVFVVTQTPLGGITTGIVYRSVNGGSSFGQLGVVTLAGTEVITSFDVSPDYDGTGVLVVGIAEIATNAVVATALSNVQVWGLNNVLSWTLYGSATLTDISAVKFSPNFAIDTTILVVSSLAGAQPILRSIVGGTWDTMVAATNVGATAVTDVDLTGSGVATDLIAADIALPSDYNGQVSTLRRAYVSIVGEAAAGTATGPNVYRITNVTAGTAIATAAALLLSNIDYSGTFSEGTLIGGLWAAAGSTKCDVYRTSNPTASVVDWYAVSGAANKPSGTTEATMSDNTTTFVQMSANFANDSIVVVGTVGDDSAFGVSTDGAVSFNETGLIDNSATGGATNEGTLATLTDIELSPAFASDSTIFLVTENDNLVNNNSNVWFSTNGGTHWTRAFTASWATAGTGTLACSSAFATDSVVYAAETGAGALDIWYSSTAGQTWSARAVSGLTAIQTVAAPDASLVYVGDTASGNIGKSTNSGWTWPTALRKDSGATGPVVSLKVKDNTLLVGGTGGTVRRSDDGSVTWAKVSTTLTAAAVYVDFDGTTVYAIEVGSGDIFRSVDAGAWAEIAAATTGADAIELILAADGALYYLELAGDEAHRSINPTAAVPTPNVTFQAMLKLPAQNGEALSVVSAGSGNTVCVLDAAANIRIYTDTLSVGTVGPNLVSPADGTVLTRALATRFTIEAMAKVTAYSHEWSTDSTFDSAVTATAIAAPSVQTAALTITEGATVYWRARATTPLNSPWSDVWIVETQVITAVNAPTPNVPGAQAGSTVDVPIDIVFNWTAFKYASGYEAQLALDSAMTDFVADLSGANALGNVTSWKPETPLEYSTTYYWRVRAIRGVATAYSDWSNIVGFTTEAAPAAEAWTCMQCGLTFTSEAALEAHIADVHAPVTPTTPAYIWAIIAIGAVLAIVVIVLITRTRRVV